MPNPGKYKSVGLYLDSYDKLIFISDQEDRAIGRQLARMIDKEYTRLSESTGKEMSKRSSVKPRVDSGLGGYAVIED